MLKISEIYSKISQTLNSPVTDTFDVGGYIFKLSTLHGPAYPQLMRSKSRSWNCYCSIDIN